MSLSKVALLLGEFWCLSRLNVVARGSLAARLWTCARGFTQRTPICRWSGPGCWACSCVCLALTTLGRNLPQALLAVAYDVSQATASRIIAAYLDS